MFMDCSAIIWLVSFNFVMNLTSIWILVSLYADQRRIERRYAILLGEEDGK
jgi:hypothetical protein